MNRSASYLNNRRGIGTVELMLVLAALVSVALMLKNEWMGFTEMAIARVFTEPPKAERLTFGGDSRP